MIHLLHKVCLIAKISTVPHLQYTQIYEFPFPIRTDRIMTTLKQRPENHVLISYPEICITCNKTTIAWPWSAKISFTLIFKRLPIFQKLKNCQIFTPVALITYWMAMKYLKQILVTNNSMGIGSNWWDKLSFRCQFCK